MSRNLKLFRMILRVVFLAILICKNRYVTFTVTCYFRVLFYLKVFLLNILPNFYVRKIMK